jgi:DNA-binding CsgD family transcriptional regulator
LGARRFERGDYAACDVLIDLASAIAAARLTPRQREALRLYYVEDLTLEDVGARMGIAKERVSQLCSSACVKIANVFSRWGYGEVRVTYDEGPIWTKELTDEEMLEFIRIHTSVDVEG